MRAEHETGSAIATRPVRLQLSRARGFKLQALSMSVNGLPAMKVDRTTKWGNPFVPGKPIPFGPMQGATVEDVRHAFVLYRSFAPLNEGLVTAARSELKGKNLACWCRRHDVYEDACHGAVLLELANG